MKEFLVPGVCILSVAGLLACSQPAVDFRASGPSSVRVSASDSDATAATPPGEGSGVEVSTGTDDGTAGTDDGSSGSTDPGAGTVSPGGDGSGETPTTVGEPVEDEDEDAKGRDGGTPSTPVLEDAGEEDVGACRKHFSGAVGFVKVTGNHREHEGNYEAGPGQVLVARLSGNHPRAVLNFDGSASTARPKVGGVCVILHGNQALATVNLKALDLARFVLIASGNQPKAIVNLVEQAHVEQIDSRIRGNQGSLVVNGSKDSFPCANPKEETDGRVSCTIVRAK